MHVASIPAQPSRCRRAGPADPEPSSPVPHLLGDASGWLGNPAWAGQSRDTAVPAPAPGAAAVLTPEHLSDIDSAAPQGSPTAGCLPAGKRRENLPTNRAASQASRFVFFLLNKLL